MSVLRQQYDMLKQKAESGKVLSVKELASFSKLEKELAGELGSQVFEDIKELEKYTGYARQTIYDAVGKGELIRQTDKTFLQDDVDVWLSAKGRKPKQLGLETVTSDVDNGDREKAETDYRKYRAEREQLLVEKMRGEMLPKEEVERQWVNRAIEFRTTLLLLSRRVSHKIASETGVDIKVVDEILDKEAVEILKSLTRPLELQVD